MLFPIINQCSVLSRDLLQPECDEYIRIFEYFRPEYLFGYSFVSKIWYEYIRIFVRVKIHTNVTLWLQLSRIIPMINMGHLLLFSVLISSHQSLWGAVQTPGWLASYGKLLGGQTEWSVWKRRCWWQLTTSLLLKVSRKLTLTTLSQRVWFLDV